MKKINLVLTILFILHLATIPHSEVVFSLWWIVLSIIQCTTCKVIAITLCLGLGYNIMKEEKIAWR